MKFGVKVYEEGNEGTYILKRWRRRQCKR